MNINFINWSVFRVSCRIGLHRSKLIVVIPLVYIIWAIMVRISKGQGRMSLIPDVLDYFPEVDNDLSKIIWGHALNDQQLIEEALSNESAIMMLEADVSNGHLKGITDKSITNAIPIMSHPPNNVSDTSLEMWIVDVIRANKAGKRKGAKLDFKNTDIMMKSLDIIRNHSAEITFPLWLNADIVRGPGGENSTPVDADIFLSLCSEFFPDATLSVGWTTANVEGQTPVYTKEMMEEMIDTIKRNHIHQPITFPIRAAFVSNSLDNLELLMKSFEDETITIWTSASDSVNFEGLASLQDRLGTDAVYFDIPDVEKLKVSSIRSEDSINTDNKSDDKPTSSSSLCRTSLTCLVIALVISLFIRSL